jgi:phosphoglycerate dehydrogenase-like enzyme
LSPHVPWDSRDPEWRQRTLIVDANERRVLGSIGAGNIGQEVFRLAMPFEMVHEVIKEK